MLYNFLFPLADQVPVFNLFRYLTFRTGGALMTALVLSFIVGPGLIRWLKSKQGMGQPIRDDGPESHILQKQGTPTMGGVLILLALSVGTLLWADLTNRYVWAVLIVTTGFGLVGFVDDYLKVSDGSVRGVPGRIKFVIELSIAGLAVAWIASVSPEPLSYSVACFFSVSGRSRPP